VLVYNVAVIPAKFSMPPCFGKKSYLELYYDCSLNVH